MFSVKLQLFDGEDMKVFEDVLTRALVRAMRVLKKEGLIPGYQPPAAERIAESPAPPPPPEPEPEPEPEPAPLAATAVNGSKQKRRSAREVCKTVGERPNGYVTTDEVLPLIGGTASDRTVLGQWILNGEVSAVIVAGVKGLTPTKGLPGRLMVDKQTVIEREAARRHNAATLPQLKAAAAARSRSASAAAPPQ